MASEGFGNGMSCFAAFYVKWLEASGMRVAVIPYDAPAVLLDQFLASVNGILFTGGGLSLAFNTTYYQVERHRMPGGRFIAAHILFSISLSLSLTLFIFIFYPLSFCLFPSISFWISFLHGLPFPICCAL